MLARILIKSLSLNKQPGTNPSIYNGQYKHLITANEESHQTNIYMVETLCSTLCQKLIGELQPQENNGNLTLIMLTKTPHKSDITMH